MTGYRLADQGIPDGPWTSAAVWSRAGWRVHRAAGADDGPGAATIPESAAQSAQRVPHRVAVSVDGQAVTHGQLDAEAKLVAGWLAGRLEPGERMLLAAGTSLGFLRWYLGALRAGVVVVLANPGYTTAELAHLVADSGARLAVADPVPAPAGWPGSGWPGSGWPRSGGGAGWKGRAGRAGGRRGGARCRFAGHGSS